LELLQHVQGFLYFFDFVKKFLKQTPQSEDGCSWHLPGAWKSDKYVARKRSFTDDLFVQPPKSRGLRDTDRLRKSGMTPVSLLVLHLASTDLPA